MKALIIDDEEKAREMLQFLVGTYVPEISEIAMAASAGIADEILFSFRPDLVFLDIKMPGRDGFDWLRAQTDHSFSVIFTTAYDQYAIKAIRFAAFDYLLKPIDALDLRETVDRYLQKERLGRDHFENLFYNRAQKDPHEYRLTIATNEGTHYLDPKEIVRCEADGNYTYFQLQGGRRIIASRPIGFFAELLSEQGFLRCHKSHLINVKFVTKYSETGLTMADQSYVELSRRRRKIIKENLDEFFGSRNSREST
jgi:two-component system LytT family response regulator